MVRDPGLVMRWHRLDDARRLTGEALLSRYYWLEMLLQRRPRLVRTRLGLQIVYWMILTPPFLAFIYAARSRGVRLRLQIEFPNPKLASHAMFKPSFLVADSYVGTVSGPRPGRLKH